MTPDSVQLHVRQQGAVQFKNFVKYHWAPKEHDDALDASAAAITLRDEEKEQIKIQKNIYIISSISVLLDLTRCGNNIRIRFCFLLSKSLVCLRISRNK